MTTPAAALPATPTRSSLTIPGTDWTTYDRLLRAFAERPGVRLTYDRGVLEIMSPTMAHDSDGRFIGRLVIAMADELGLEALAGGSTTLRRRLKRRGLEPDECFWIQNEPAVRGVRRLNLRIHPPPDLAIEVDVTRSSLDRLAIYAVLAVPEVWRLDRPNLTFHGLGADARYALLDRSRAFPQVAPADILGPLGQRGQTGDGTLVRQFRAWFRQQLPPAPPPAP